MKKYSTVIALLLSFLLVLSGCGTSDVPITNEPVTQEQSAIETNIPVTEDNSIEKTSSTVKEEEKPQLENKAFDIGSIPEYAGNPYVAVNNNIPFFTESDLTTQSFERYSNLDSLGRCGVACASVGKDIMPTEERGSIGMVKPTGWHSVRYKIVDGLYLYNRCHLRGFQLTGENANERNLITCTRYLNINGMLPFENMVADYVQETDKHVMYRVTPIFEGNNLLASGVLMEGYSVEDNGEGICFNVYCYNVQPGIKINYSNGDNEAEDGSAPYGSSGAVANSNNNKNSNAASSAPSSKSSYIGNRNTKKFHYSYCSSVNQMKDTNKVPISSREQAISQGYDPCGRCNP